MITPAWMYLVPHGRSSAVASNRQRGTSGTQMKRVLYVPFDVSVLRLSLLQHSPLRWKLFCTPQQLRLYCCCRVVYLSSIWCAADAQFSFRVASLLRCSGVNSERFKSQKVVAERGQKSTGVKRSNSKANVTITATINATGNKVRSLFSFEDKRVQAKWVCKSDPRDSWYVAADSSFMQRAFYLSLIEKIKQ